MSDVTSKMIDCSTGHIPQNYPDWGGVRVCSHEYGYIVFVAGKDLYAQNKDDVPEWLQPLYELALEHDCILINFDRDGDHIDGIPSWEW